MSADDQKRRAAQRALDFVTDGMALGLGTGSTAAHFIRELGSAVARGLNVRCVPTSQTTARLAHSLNIPLVGLDEVITLDLTVDGADEINPALDLIKGGGGALLREKIVAAASSRMIVIADATKQVDMLGAFPLPVEVFDFGAEATAAAIGMASRTLGLAGGITPRMGADGPFETEEGNLIYDCTFSAIPDPPALARALGEIPGVVEHGLFIHLCTLALIGTPGGVVEVMPDNGASARIS